MQNLMVQATALALAVSGAARPTLLSSAEMFSVEATGIEAVWLARLLMLAKTEDIVWWWRWEWGERLYGASAFYVPPEKIRCCPLFNGLSQLGGPGRAAGLSDREMVTCSAASRPLAAVRVRRVRGKQLMSPPAERAELGDRTHLVRCSMFL